MLGKFSKRYCGCEEWQKGVASEYSALQLERLLQYYPDECPYCHEPLKRKQREIEFVVRIEGELYNNPEFHTLTLPMRELKELLKELK